MPLFGRKKDNDPFGLEETKDGYRFNVDTIPEAKLVIKQLRIKKKEFGVEKKVVAGEMARIRAERRAEVARQGSKVRGGGKFGRFARDMQTIGRDGDRLRHEKDLAPWEQRKAAIERKIMTVDESIAYLERWMIEAAMEEGSKK